MTEKSTKILALLTSFVVVNGIIYLSIYYQHFGIGIFSYLDFSEIITAFLDRIQMTLIFFTFYLLYASIFTYIGFSTAQKHKDYSEDQVNIFKNKLNKIQKRIIVFHVVSCFTLVILISLNYIQLKTWLIYFFIFSAINVFQSLSNFISEKFSDILRGKAIAIFLSITFLFIPFTLGTIAFAVYESQNKFINNQTVKLLNENREILINPNFKFIGKTKNYIFLYNFKTDEGMSISLENIKTIIYK